MKAKTVILSNWWKPIPIAPEYEASYFGGFIKKGNQLISSYVNQKGYVVCTVRVNGEWKKQKVSRLVAFAWVSNPDNKPEVNHEDGIKLNNDVPNLTWNTRSENVKHSWDKGLCKKRTSEQYAGYAKLRKVSTKELVAS